ncbi:hypothetical protein EON66_04330 [archaeon]|nr:MAG: hypothetical protein EON66_04330 [archaeon]
MQADHIAVRRDPFDTRFSIMERVAYAIVVGVTCVNCVSIKFTGLATPGLIGLESLLAMFFLKRSIPLFDLLVVLLTGFLTFATYYWIHFSLLPFSGDGDGFMPWEFQQSLLNSTNYDPTVEPPSFPYMLYEVRTALGARACARARAPVSRCALPPVHTR